MNKEFSLWNKTKKFKHFNIDRINGPYLYDDSMQRIEVRFKSRVLFSVDFVAKVVRTYDLYADENLFHCLNKAFSELGITYRIVIHDNRVKIENLLTGRLSSSVSYSGWSFA